MRLFHILFWIVLCLVNSEAQDHPQNQILAQVKAARALSFTAPDSALAMIDAIWPKSEQMEDSIHFFVIRGKGRIFQDNQLWDSCAVYYAQSLALTEKGLPLDYRFKAYTDWAILQKHRGDYETANEYHSRCIQLGWEHSNWKMVEYGEHGLGILSAYLGNFDNAIQHYYKSIEAAEKLGNIKGISASLQNIANNCLKSENLTLAQTNIKKAWEVAIESGDSNRMMATHRIHGRIDFAAGNLNSAEEKLNRSYKYFQEKAMKSFAIEVLLDLAKIAETRGDMLAADSLFSVCHNKEKWFLAYDLALFYKDWGIFLQKQGKTEAALKALQSSIEKSKGGRYKDVSVQSTLALSNILYESGQFAEAFQVQKQRDSLQHYIFEENKQKYIASAQLNFDNTKLQLQLDAKNKSLEVQKNIKIGLLAGIALLAGLLYYSWLQFTAKQKAVFHSELLMKELHHRVKNNLQTITSIMRLQARQFRDPTVIKVLGDNRERLEAISTIHRQMYKSDDIEQFDICFVIADFIEKLSFTHNIDSDSIEKDIQINSNIKDADTGLTMSLIIHELLTNSYKYAFQQHPNPKISLSLTNHQLIYSDNGRGAPAEARENSTGFGLQLIQSLAKQAGAKCSFCYENGFQFKMICGPEPEETSDSHNQGAKIPPCNASK